MYILPGYQIVDMNTTGRPERWYEYYRVTINLICILRVYQKVGMNITGRPKIGMNITG
jgi:hypothetical protein